LCGGDLWGYGILAADAMREQMKPILERGAALVNPEYTLPKEAAR
jgi:hypothetical protein